MISSGKKEAIPLKRAAAMIGLTDRALAALIRQGKIDTVMDGAHRRRGRPPILVSRGSLEDYARVNYLVLREMSGEDARRGRNVSLSSWLSQSGRLMKMIRKAGIYEIDGEGAEGRVWVRFYGSRTKHRSLLSCFRREEGSGSLGSRSFRIEFHETRADVFLRGKGSAEDCAGEIERVIEKAAKAVAGEEERLKGGKGK